MMNDKIIKSTLGIIAFVLTCTLIIIQNFDIDRYQLNVGSVSPTKIKSPEEIINKYQTDILKEEAKKQVAKVYKVDEKINKKIQQSLVDFFNDVEHNRVSYDFMEEYNNNIEEGETPKVFDFSSVLDDYTDIDTEELITMSDEDYEILKNAVNTVMSETVLEGVSEDSLSKTSVLMKESLKLKIEARFVDLAFNVVLNYLEPNFFLDEESTNLAIQSAINSVVPIMIKEGQTIVDEGDIITEETYSILTEIGFIKNSSAINIPIVLGYIILVFLVFVSFYSYIKKHNSKSLIKKNIYVSFFVMYVLAIFSMFFLRDTIYNIYIPLLFIFWIAVLINYKLAYAMTAIFSLIGMGISNYDNNSILFLILSGIFMVSFSNTLVNRIGILRVVIYVCLFNATLMTILLTVLKSSITENWFTSQTFIEIGVSVGSTIIILFLAFGAMPIWEAMFGILTPTTLMELTKPSNPLLRRLTLEAPGTYHHSLVVANLAEEAALAIGANSNLARVGSYYHDVGKLTKPTCFAENQENFNIHDRLSVEQSVKVIKSHVTEGVRLAKEHRIPAPILDFITQHHGNTLVKYFYLKALETNPDINENDFRYDGTMPKTKEVAIVMLADTVEAAVRSIIKKASSMDEVYEFVNKLISDKVLDGQLNHCNITLAEIETIKETFNGVFKAMYHDRIAYPEEKEEETRFQ